VINKKGLPGLLVLIDKLITLSDYNQKLTIVAKDNSKFAGRKHHWESIPGNIEV
jgi:hypothetical protein